MRNIVLSQTFTSIQMGLIIAISLIDEGLKMKMIVFFFPIRFTGSVFAFQVQVFNRKNEAQRVIYIKSKATLRRQLTSTLRFSVRKPSLFVSSVRSSISNPSNQTPIFQSTLLPFIIKHSTIDHSPSFFAFHL